MSEEYEVESSDSRLLLDQEDNNDCNDDCGIEPIANKHDTHHLMVTGSNGTACQHHGGWTIQTNKDLDVDLGSRRVYFDAVKQRLARYKWIRDELVAQIKLSFPIILTWLFQNLMAFVSLIFVGHISGRALELDSVALATSFINVAGLSIGIGISSAADTLCAQTFGFKNYKRVGHIVQQGIMILTLLCLFVWGVWLNTDNLLLLLQQPPCISRLAGYYTKIFGLCLPAFYVYVMLQKYLQSQSHVWPFIMVGFLANIINVILHAVLLLVLDLGIIGAGISMVISNIFQPLCLIVYIRVRNMHRLTWGGWSWESLRDWWQFLKLGIPGMAMICLEWVSYEIVVFVLGSISELELAINSILVNLLVILFMIPLGISITSGVRVGNALGAGNPKDAKRTAFISLLLVVINAALSLTFLLSVKNMIAPIYTKEQAVLHKLPIVITVVCPGLFFDQVQLVIQGVLRGCGLQTLGAVINFIAFYCFGLPLGISLAFKTNLGVIGVWIGLMCATTSQCVVYFIIILRMNWEKQSMKAQERASRGDHDNDNGGVHKEQVSYNCSLTEKGSIALEDIIASNKHHHNDDDTLIEEDVMDDTEILKDNEDDDSQTTALLSEDDAEEGLTTSSIDNKRSGHSKLKLMLTKGSLFVIGAVFLVIAGVASNFEVPEYLYNGNFTECTNYDNLTDIS